MSSSKVAFISSQTMTVEFWFISNSLLSSSSIYNILFSINKEFNSDLIFSVGINQYNIKVYLGNDSYSTSLHESSNAFKYGYTFTDI